MATAGIIREELYKAKEYFSRKARAEDCLLYTSLLLALGAVERDDVLLLPKGEKIADILHLK